MPIEDKRTRRLVEREINKHPIDNTLLVVSCINQVIYLGGVVKRLRGTLGRNVELRDAMNNIIEAIKDIPGVKDVVCDYRIA